MRSRLASIRVVTSVRVSERAKWSNAISDVDPRCYWLVETSTTMRLLDSLQVQRSLRLGDGRALLGILWGHRRVLSRMWAENKIWDEKLINVPSPGSCGTLTGPELGMVAGLKGWWDLNNVCRIQKWNGKHVRVWSKEKLEPQRLNVPGSGHRLDSNWGFAEVKDMDCHHGLCTFECWGSLAIHKGK